MPRRHQALREAEPRLLRKSLRRYAHAMLGDEGVAVIGSGSMGIALAHAAATAGRRTTVWCPDVAAAEAVTGRFDGSCAPHLEGRVRTSTVLADVVRDVSLVIVTVRSQQFRETARALGSLGVTGKSWLSSTKAFEHETCLRMSQILANETRTAAVGIVAGANITPEIVADDLTAIVVASCDSEVGTLAKRCLESPQLRVSCSEDLLSIELAAALKNVVAIGVGIAAGLGLGFNARSIVFACGLREITRLGAALGADQSGFAGVAGAGDLFLTASSPDSLNRRLGVALGHGRALSNIVAELPETPEGIGSVRACRALARRYDLRLPITEAVAAILEGERAPNEIEAACREAPLT
jgi:glycerol-3-phosphate dehydrogenase (NAD(P)+)